MHGWDTGGFRKHVRDFLMLSEFNISLPSNNIEEPRSVNIKNDIAIRVTNISKCYQIYNAPRDRLKQFIMPKLQRLFLRTPKLYFKEFRALDEISFDIKKGETVGIIGCNGSGKSTLLQIICGTLHPTNGKVETNGRVAALLELGSGFNPEFTGRENVYLNATVLGLSAEEIDARFDDIVNFSGIEDFIEQPVKTYSSGMMMRLAFAVAINVEPDILIIDEALSVGDELFQRKCFSRIEAIKNNGATILFVSHSANTIVELCDYAILLNAGSLLAIGIPKHIVSKYQKLLYAPLNKHNEILEEIRLISKNKTQQNTHESAHNKICPEHAEKPIEFFDPNLIPENKFEFESHGIDISNTQITDLQDRHINHLLHNQKYKYKFQVRFNRPATSVRFGMLIKSTTGLPLGGALSAASLVDAISYVNAESIIHVEFYFNCYVNPGLYFLNAGVFGSIGEEEIVLHRIVDAVAFRVLPVENNVATEIINFNFSSETTING